MINKYNPILLTSGYRCMRAAVMVLTVILCTAGSAWAMPADQDTGSPAGRAAMQEIGSPAGHAAIQDTGRTFDGAAEQGSSHGSQEALHITRKLEPGQEQAAAKPSETYWDRDGREYRLDRWEMVTVPGHRMNRRLERQVVYAGVEGAEGLPESIAVEEEVSGIPAEGNLTIRHSRVLGESWKDGFAAPVTFHSYGAEEYRAGSLVVQGEDVLGTSVAMGGELLAVMGLSPMEYRILSMEWAGEPYEDQDGLLCRQALAIGQKLLRDYEITYEGEVSWMEPDTFQLEMTYRPAVPVRELTETDVTVEEPAAGTQTEEDTLWYWVRSGFIITVGAGLIGIAVGLLTLLVLWYRQNRRIRRSRYLPQIKG